MKLSTFITAAVAATMLTVGPGNAREAIVGLSPLQPPEVLQEQVERVIQHLVETVEPGETAHLFDASNVWLIGSFVVPDRDAYANPRAKLQANRRLIADLKRFIDSAKPIPGREAHVDLPGLLRTVREHYPSDGDRAFIVLGSPIYDDPLAPSLSMQGGRVPNDGHVAASLDASPFGTADLNGSLDGTDMYFGLVGPEDWVVSPEHAFHADRFWTLSVEGHGGTMQYMGDDLETLFRQAEIDSPDRRHADPLVPTDKLEMLRFLPDTGEVPDIQGADTADAPPPEPVWRAAVDPVFGLIWDCLACDLDLHVRVRPDASVIYYGRPETPEGQLYKDYRDAPTTGFETIATSGTFDLTETRVAVNFYSGQTSGDPVRGELRVAIGDAVWTATFMIEADRGNHGRGVEATMDGGVAPTEHWVVFETVTLMSDE